MTHDTSLLIMFTFLWWTSPKAPAAGKPLNSRTEEQTEWFKWEDYNYNNIGLIHLDPSEYDSAITFFRRSLSVNAETGNEEEQCKNLLNIGLTFSYMGQADSANAYFKNARVILDRNDFPKTDYVYWDYQYDFNYTTGNYKEALEANIKKNAFEWDQYKNEYENKIAELEVRYDMAVKEKEFSEMKKKHRQTETIALLVLLVSIIVVLIKVYFEKTKWLNKSKALYDQINEKVHLLRNLNEENERIKNNLEKLVKQETEQVTRQNEKLRKFAFINSHTIRGPVARILGLINVIALENDSLKNHTAFSKLYESSNELDKVIRKMGDVLADDE
jgi:tetratricopeptide (TPR) repeat protein